MDVQNWNQLPSEVFECFLFLKSGFRTRFQPSKHRLTDAALDLVHPGHKNFSWLSGVERIQAHSLFKEELFRVAGVDIDAADAPDDQPNVQSTGKGAKIALDAFFDFDLHDMQVLDYLSLRQLSTKETVEFRRYLQAESINWCSNEVMEWWSYNEGNFPTVRSKQLALKYLAIPASSAPIRACLFTAKANP